MRPTSRALRPRPCVRRTACDPFRAMDTLQLGIKGKVAVVTGAMGWGRAAVEQFARSEARVVACARRKDVLERAMETSRRVAAAGATRSQRFACTWWREPLR